MTRRNPPAKWVLPDVIDPPDSICYKIPVPNNRYHRAAFWGALLDLASAYKWADDLSHTAKAVALVWRNIVDNLITIECGDIVALHGGILQEEFMPIRVDCDCNVWITCCDGTEVQLATVPMLQQSGQPGAGGPTPPTYGHCLNTTGAINGNGQWYAPFVVNSGDVITLSNVKGATYNPTAAIWQCPDGSLFFAGACVASSVTNGGNPLPGSLSGRLIAKIGATYYDVIGGPFTVPGGIVDQPFVLLFNYDSPATSTGTVNFGIEFCNNAAPVTAWVSTLNFKISPYSAFINPVSATWVAGAGYEGISDPSCAFFCYFDMTLDAFNIDGMDIIYDVASLGGASQGVFIHIDTLLYGAPAVPTVGNPEVFTINQAYSGAMVVQPALCSGSTGGIDHIQSVVIRGHGLKPAQLP